MDISSEIATFIFFLGLGAGSLALRCPGPDWWYRAGTEKCYFFHEYGQDSALGIIPTKVTYFNMITECQARGGSLLTLENAQELDWLVGKLSNNHAYWLGLTFENLKWQWFDGVKNTSDYVPLPNIAVVDPPASMPEADRRKQRGVLEYLGMTNKFAFRYGPAGFAEHNGYICKGDWSTRPWCKVEDGWTYRFGACYRFSPLKKTFVDAENFCLAEGGYISVPSSEEEQEHVRKWLSVTMNVERGWLGISVKNKQPDLTYETLKWADDTPAKNTTTFSHWREPDMTSFVAKIKDGANYCGEMVLEHDACESGGCLMPFAWELGQQCNQDHCYQLNEGANNRLSWDDAQKYCHAQESDLALVFNKEIQDFLEVTFKSSSHSSLENNHYWIGIRDKDSTGKYEWQVGGFPTTWTNFEGGAQPTEKGKCIFADGDQDSDPFGLWKPADCGDRLHFVCQAHYTSLIKPPVIHPAQVCKPPFVKFHDGCYLVVHDPKNRDDAQKFCQLNSNSVLVTVDLFGVNAWLQTKITTDSWMGLRIVRTEPDGNSTKFVYETAEYKNITGKPFMNFEDKNDPSDIPTHLAYCTVLAGPNSGHDIGGGKKATAGKWYHAACTEVREFVCYHDSTPEAVPPPIDSNFDPQCGAGWFRNGQDCYQIHNQEVPWQLAKQICQNADPTSDLLWMVSRAEERYIKDYVEKYQADSVNIDDNYWIDFYADTPTANWYWPYREFSDKWQLPVAVTNWARDHPAAPTGPGSESQPRCAYIKTNSVSSQWESISCETLNHFICKKILMQEVNATTPSGQSMGCKSGWTEGNANSSQCTLTITEKLNWAEALEACEEKGGSLYTINIQADAEAVKGPGDESWVGLNAIKDYNDPRVFVWADGSPTSYTPWDIESSHADNSSNGINCGVFTSKGLAMAVCSEKKTAICGSPLQAVVPSGSAAEYEGMSGGAIAGLVIGVLLLVALIGFVVFIRITGRTEAVVSRFRSITTIRSSGVRSAPPAQHTRFNDRHPIEEDI